MQFLFRQLYCILDPVKTQMVNVMLMSNVKLSHELFPT